MEHGLEKGMTVQGFEFELGANDIGWPETMKSNVGKIGVVVEISDDSFKIRFREGNFFYYPLSQWKKAIVPTKKESIFKVGDRVFDYQYGWGEVEVIDDPFTYPVKVRFDSGNIDSYTEDAKSSSSGDPVLSFTEYKMVGFSLERPKFKEGDECVYIDSSGNFSKRVWNIELDKHFGDLLLTMEEFKEYIIKNY